MKEFSGYAVFRIIMNAFPQRRVHPDASAEDFFFLAAASLFLQSKLGDVVLADVMRAIIRLDIQEKEEVKKRGWDKRRKKWQLYRPLRDRWMEIWRITTVRTAWNFFRTTLKLIQGDFINKVLSIVERIF